MTGWTLTLSCLCLALTSVVQGKCQWDSKWDGKVCNGGATVMKAITLNQAVPNLNNCLNAVRADSECGQYAAYGLFNGLGNRYCRCNKISPTGGGADWSTCLADGGASIHEEICDAGNYVKNQPSQGPLTTTDHCERSNTQEITTATVCEEAAISLNIFDAGWEGVTTQSNIPPGCIFKDSYGVVFNDYDFGSSPLPTGSEAQTRFRVCKSGWERVGNAWDKSITCPATGNPAVVSASSAQDCQYKCDAWPACNAVRFEVGASTQNCHWYECADVGNVPMTSDAGFQSWISRDYGGVAKCDSITGATAITDFCVDNGANGLINTADAVDCQSDPCVKADDAATCCKAADGVAPTTTAGEETSVLTPTADPTSTGTSTADPTASGTVSPADTPTVTPTTTFTTAGTEDTLPDSVVGQSVSVSLLMYSAALAIVFGVQVMQEP